MSAASLTVAGRRPGSPRSVRLSGLEAVGLDPRVRSAEALMRRNLHRRLCLEELARASSLSASRLSHLFKAETGVSPLQRLKTLRLEAGMDLLENSSLSVKQIAARVGWDPSRFVHEFRKAYGLTPLCHRCGRAPAASTAVGGIRSDASVFLQVL